MERKALDLRLSEAEAETRELRYVRAFLSFFLFFFPSLIIYLYLFILFDFLYNDLLYQEQKLASQHHA